MTGDDDDRDGRDPDAEPPWHDSTSKLLGASVAGLVAIALVVAGAIGLSRQLNTPDDAPTEFVESTFSSSAPSGSASSTTSTITTTRPIQTTEINPGDPALAPPPPTSATETPSTRFRSPRTRETQEEDDEEAEEEASTTRSRPRLNQTRTLSPGPN